MLFWLNAADSPIAAPNENYAREFWELFTLGRDVVYTETTYASRRGSYRLSCDSTARRVSLIPFTPRCHDPGTMTIFPSRATPQNYNFMNVIDLTLAQPEAAKFVAKNLFAYSIHDHPSMK